MTMVDDLRSVWGRAAAKKGQQLLGRMVLRRTVSIKRLGGDEAGEKALRTVSAQQTCERGGADHRGEVASVGAGRVEHRCWRFRTPAKSTSRGIRAARPRSAEAATVPTRPFSCIQCWRLTRTATSSWGWPTCSSGNGMVQPRKRRPARRMRKIPPLAGWCRGGGKPARGRSAAVTVVADREGDLYPAFARRPGAVELLVRAQTERGLAGGGYLFAHLDGLPIADRFILDLPAIPGRSARHAAMVLRYGPVSLSPPRNSADRNLPATVALYALDVREIEAPAGFRRSIGAFCPVLLSILLRRRTRRSPTTAAAGISGRFRTLKSQGLDLEDSRIKTPHVLHKIAVVALRAAVVCMQLVHARGGADQRPAIAAFETEEVEVLEAIAPTVDGKTDRLKNPFPPRSLPWAAWIIARLGAWSGAKSAKPPGP